LYLIGYLYIVFAEHTTRREPLMYIDLPTRRQNNSHIIFHLSFYMLVKS